MNDPFSLVGKKILVTGASSGIGRSVAIQCAIAEAEVALTARNEVRLKETLESLHGAGHTHHLADFHHEADVEQLAENLPSLDGLVLNAAMIKTMPVKFIQSDLLREMFDVNILGSVLLVKQLLRRKKIRNGASICFISSVSSNFVQAGNSVYSATKGAVNSFSRSLALELAPKQIRVNAVLPGFVQTNILSNGPIGEEQINEHLKNYPLGRYGKPEDIAWLVRYLISDASSWMTGSLLTIDGGFSLK